jgi:RimJ/RimL family protein N-acetyltransferase
MHPTLTTPRLRLRAWRPQDVPPFAQMSADTRVMQFLPKLLTRAESAAMAARIEEHFARHGFGLWAVEVAGVADFIGFVGLSVPNFQAHFTPCVEVGWRLAYKHWGQGYATEAANAALHFAFGQLHLEEVVSFTVPANDRSRRVMERLGMARSPDDDFDHPNLAIGHRLRRHILYRLPRCAWRPLTCGQGRILRNRHHSR